MLICIQIISLRELVFSYKFINRAKLTLKCIFAQAMEEAKTGFIILKFFVALSCCISN